MVPDRFKISPYGRINHPHFDYINAIYMSFYYSFPSCCDHALHDGNVCIVDGLRVLAQSIACDLHRVVFIDGEMRRSLNIARA
jgi:hypothetical protein